MPAPKRIPNSTFILVPSEGHDINAVVHYSRVAGRVAMAKNLLPLSPLLFYMAYMTEEELDKALPVESVRLMKRASKIWLCSMGSSRVDDVGDLDALSHRILRDNEGLLAPRRKRYAYSSRVPVHYFTQDKDGSSNIRALDRLEISSLLQCNIVSGLLSGVSHAV